VIKDIRHLSKEIRFMYGKVLFAGVMELEDLDSKIIEEFYRVLSYIELPNRERKKIFEWYQTITGAKNMVETLINYYPLMVENLNEQEESIMGYMLLEDTYHIVYGNSFETEEKVQLLDELMKFLNIKEEQFNHFDISKSLLGKTEEISKRTLSKSISALTGLGLPLLFLYHSKHNAYRHDFKSFSFLQIEKKFRKDLQYNSLGKILVSGLGICYGMKWIMDRKHREELKTHKLLQQEEDNTRKMMDKMILEDKKWFSQNSNAAMNSNLKNFKMHLMKYCI